MTAVAIWINKEMAPPSIWAVADTRISGPGIADRPIPMIEEATKLFTLPVACYKPDHSGFFAQLYFSHSIGLAYSGSSLVALNVYAALIPMLSSLGSVDGYVPHLEDIAGFVARLLARYTISRNQLLRDGAIAEASVFGYCHPTSRLRIFHLTPIFEPLFNVRHEETCTASDTDVLLLGGHKDEIVQAIAAARDEYEIGSLPWWRTPKQMIANLIEREVYPTIGGALQIGIATPQGSVRTGLYHQCRAQRLPLHCGFSALRLTMTLVRWVNAKSSCRV
jgi:hypothetical protein